MPVVRSGPIGTSSHSDVSLADSLAVVDDRSIYGARLVVKRLFKRGELILPLLGELTAQSHKTIQIGMSAHLRGTLIAFINHSCSPTGIADVKALRLVANRDISAGEEITFFYPSTEWQMVRPFKCLCGTAKCIGYIAGAKYLSSDILGRYFINPHVRDLTAKALAELGVSARCAVAG